MTWLENNWSWALELTWQHLKLAAPAIVIAVAAAVVLGRLAHSHRLARQIVLGTASIVYAIPSLPLLIAIPAVLGIPLRSPLTLILALGLYGTALLVGTATDAFDSVDKRVHESAEAMGFARAALFWKVDLPLAIPVLMSGIRVTTVSTVGLVTIGALVGTSSLGTLLTDGLQRGIMAEVMTGIVLVVAIALLLDALLVLASRAATPWQSTRTRVLTRSEVVE